MYMNGLRMNLVKVIRISEVSRYAKCQRFFFVHKCKRHVVCVFHSQNPHLIFLLAVRSCKNRIVCVCIASHRKMKLNEKLFICIFNRKFMFPFFYIPHVSVFESIHGTAFEEASMRRHTITRKHHYLRHIVIIKKTFSFHNKMQITIPFRLIQTNQQPKSALKYAFMFVKKTSNRFIGF